MMSFEELTQKWEHGFVDSVSLDLIDE